jgi:hypothetical protein
LAKIVGTSEQMIKNHLHSTFDKLGVWSRLELAMYVANYRGKGGFQGSLIVIPSADADSVSTDF